MDNSAIMLLLSAIFAALSVGLLVFSLYPRKTLAEAEQIAGKERILTGFRRLLVKKTGLWMRWFLTPRHDAWLRKKIQYAGGLKGLVPEDFLALQLFSAIGFTLFGLILLNALKVPLWSIFAFTIFGAFFPHIWLRDRIKKRHFGITRALPYNLDLITLSVEAGLDFNAALGKAVDKGKGGPLLEEFSLLLKHLRMGKTRQEALADLADRNGLPSLSQVCNTLIQADRMGTGLGRALRILSNQMRTERTNRAEKLAGEAPVKMLFPLLFCIFPCVFLILFGPLLWQLLFGTN